MIKQQTYSYFAFGLQVQSPFPLPQLMDCSGEADVVISLGPVSEPHSSALVVPPISGLVAASSEEYHFHWENIGKFSVREGKYVQIEPALDVPEQVLHLPLLGVIFATLLHQRGILVLHASAVNIEGQTAAFIGNKGWGKSTTAATLHGRGHTLITDDVLAISLANPDRPVVLPGFPQFKLWPEAAASSLGDNPDDVDTLPYLVEGSGFTKRARRAQANFSLEPVPLGSIYVLAGGDSLQIVPLSPNEALAQLVAHSYCSRFPKQMLSGLAGMRHFQQCAAVVNHASVKELQRQRDLEALPLVAQIIEDDAKYASLPQNNSS
jgi:hypothetical protein